MLLANHITAFVDDAVLVDSTEAEESPLSNSSQTSGRSTKMIPPNAACAKSLIPHRLYQCFHRSARTRGGVSGAGFIVSGKLYVALDIAKHGEVSKLRLMRNRYVVNTFALFPTQERYSDAD